jgi:uncharacterized protein YndB with AHSA1/START domain
MEPLMNKITFKFSRHINATPECVFDTLLDPEKAKNFMFASPSGESVSASIDARVGGSFLFVDKSNDGGAHTGTFLEIERPHRIVLTLIFKKISDDVTKLTVDISPEYEGSTLSFYHEVPANWAEHKACLEEGWEDVFNRLEKTISCSDSFLNSYIAMPAKKSTQTP